MESDAVFCDAKYFREIAAIAVVCGKIVNSKTIEVNSSDEAERAAIRFAKELYPNTEVFNDCSGACDKEGATWIPREKNGRAHRAAANEYRKLPPEMGLRPNSPKRCKKAKALRGRGVLKPGEKQRVSWMRDGKMLY